MTWWNQAKNLSPNVWALALTSFLNDIASECLVTLIPLYLHQNLKTPHVFIGLIEGVSLSITAFLKIFAGILADKIGNHKLLTAAGYLLSAISRPTLYLTTSWFWVAIVKWLDRVGKGFRGAPRDALLARSIRSSQRGTAYSLHHASETMGAVVSLFAAVCVVSSGSADDSTLSQSAYNTLVLLSFPFGVGAVLCVLCLASDEDGEHMHLHMNSNSDSNSNSNSNAVDPSPSPSPSETESINESTSDTLFLLARPVSSVRQLGSVYYVLLAIFCLFQLGNPAPAFMILFAQESGMSVSGVLLMALCYNLCYALLTAPIGWLTDRFSSQSHGRAYVIASGWLIRCAVLWLLSTSTSPVAIFVLYAVYGVYMGCTEGILKALVMDVLPENKQIIGTAFGVFNAGLGVVDVAANLIAGTLYDQNQAPLLFRLASISSLICAGLLLVWRQLVAPHAEEDLWSTGNRFDGSWARSEGLRYDTLPHTPKGPYTPHGRRVLVSACVTEVDVNNVPHTSVQPVAIPLELLMSAMGRIPSVIDEADFTANAQLMSEGRHCVGAVVVVHMQHSHAREVCVVGTVGELCQRQGRRGRPGWTWGNRWSQENPEETPLLP